MKPEITTSSKKPHYDALDGLRGIAAIAVLIGHYSDIFFAGAARRTLFYPLSNSFLAVDFFFCLSGFVIAYAYDERMEKIGIKRFFLNRLIRLHPLVMIGAILGVMVYLFSPFADNSKPIFFVFFLSLLMIPTPFFVNFERWGSLFPLNGPTWSLFFEYIANIFYAIILWRIPRKWLVFTVALCAAFLVYRAVDVGRLTGGWSVYSIIDGFARVCFSFTVGLLMYRYRIIWRHRFGFILPCLLLTGVLIFPYRWQNGMFDLFWVILILPAIMSLGAGTTVSGVTERICNLLGRISYPLYMTHFVTILFLTDFYKKCKPLYGKPFFIIISLLLIVFNFVSAYVIMRWVDEPLRKWLNHILRKK